MSLGYTDNRLLLRITINNIQNMKSSEFIKIKKNLIFYLKIKIIYDTILNNYNLGSLLKYLYISNYQYILLA